MCFFYDLYALNIFFFLTVMHSVHVGKQIWISIVSKVTPRLAKRKSSMEIEIYMIFEELVHRQKQFVELAGRFVVRGEVIF